MKERRRAVRVEPRKRIPAKVKASVPGRVVDISKTGALIEVAYSLRPEVSCELRLQVDNQEFTVRATVRRCRAWGFGFDENDVRVLLYRAGVEFDGLPEELTSRIAALLPAASGEQQAVASGAEGAAPAAPRRTGPVKIRIDARNIRKVLEGKK